MRVSLTGLDPRRPRFWLALFFLALAIPTAILIRQAYSQLKWEAFHQHRTMAEELTARIDGRFVRMIDAEEARSFADYGFLVVAGDPSASFLQRSSLSTYPVGSAIPGLVGYFQVDAAGAFSTPLLPPAGAAPSVYGISGGELDGRQALEVRIRTILSRNSLVEEAKSVALEQTVPKGSAKPEREGAVEMGPAPVLSGRDEEPRLLVESEKTHKRAKAPGQAAFDRLNEAYGRPGRGVEQAASPLGRVDDLNLEQGLQRRLIDSSGDEAGTRKAPSMRERGVRKERAALPEPPLPSLRSSRSPWLLRQGSCA
ncbi:MAG: hypothetical protein U9Q81_20105 [Pseudomonadota bacterium]|nr:hypothetical protein [Pseudomonadota bacterium]